VAVSLVGVEGTLIGLGVVTMAHGAAVLLPTSRLALSHALGRTAVSVVEPVWQRRRSRV
jgi:hypothetical protein